MKGGLVLCLLVGLCSSHPTRSTSQLLSDVVALGKDLHSLEEAFDDDVFPTGLTPIVHTTEDCEKHGDADGDDVWIISYPIFNQMQNAPGKYRTIATEFIKHLEEVYNQLVENVGDEDYDPEFELHLQTSGGYKNVLPGYRSAIMEAAKQGGWILDLTDSPTSWLFTAGGSEEDGDIPSSQSGTAAAAASVKQHEPPPKTGKPVIEVPPLERATAMFECFKGLSASKLSAQTMETLEAMGLKPEGASKAKKWGLEMKRQWWDVYVPRGKVLPRPPGGQHAMDGKHMPVTIEGENLKSYFDDVLEELSTVLAELPAKQAREIQSLKRAAQLRIVWAIYFQDPSVMPSNYFQSIIGAYKVAKDASGRMLLTVMEASSILGTPGVDWSQLTG